MELGARNYSEADSSAYLTSMIEKFCPSDRDTLHGPDLQEIATILDFECLADLETLKNKFRAFKREHKKIHKVQKSRKLNSMDRLYIYSLVKVDKIPKKDVAVYFLITLRSVNRIIAQLTAQPETALHKASTPLKKEIITEQDLICIPNPDFTNKNYRDTPNFSSEEKSGNCTMEAFVL
jgi:hypothetical protein